MPTLRRPSTTSARVPSGDAAIGPAWAFVRIAPTPRSAAASTT
jgi:hypothetical protein